MARHIPEWADSPFAVEDGGHVPPGCAPIQKAAEIPRRFALVRIRGTPQATFSTGGKGS
jgi:hypothetical protein